MIVDNNHLVRAALRDLLRATELDVVGATGSPQRALQLIGRVVPDVVILDQRLGDTTGIALAQPISERHPDVHLILYTSRVEPGMIASARAAGISDVILKRASPRSLLDCLEGLQASRQENCGGRWVST